MKNLKGRARAMQIASQVYYKWKLDDVRRTEGNPVEIINSLLDLRNEIVLKVKAEGLSDWVKFTTDLIDEKIEIVKLKGVRNVNRLILIGQPDKKHFFVNKAEFVAIPEVAKIISRQDFVGFIGKDAMVSALYDDGEVIPVGAVISDLGLAEIVLSADAVREALASKTPPGEPGSAEGPNAPLHTKARPEPPSRPNSGHSDASAEAGANPS